MRNKKILVVDDEKEVTMTLKGLFAALGHDMLTALNGDDALEIIAAEDPALIILDIRMPGVDGLEILKRLRAKQSPAKVIIITSYLKDSKDELERIGIDGLFSKPVDLNGLMERIRFVLATDQNTRYVTANVKQPPVSAKTPCARLLFIEPNPIVYGFTCAIFDLKEMIKGEYVTKVVYGGKEGMTALYDFRPDIVIMYDSLFHMDDVKRFAEIIMHQSHKPSSVILHGLIPKMQNEMEELERMSIKFCNQSTMDNEGMRLANSKLADFVADQCIKLGLTK